MNKYKQNFSFFSSLILTHLKIIIKNFISFSHLKTFYHISLSIFIFIIYPNEELIRDPIIIIMNIITILRYEYKRKSYLFFFLSCKFKFFFLYIIFFARIVSNFQQQKKLFFDSTTTTIKLKE